MYPLMMSTLVLFFMYDRVQFVYFFKPYYSRPTCEFKIQMMVLVMPQLLNGFDKLGFRHTVSNTALITITSITKYTVDQCECLKCSVYS